MSQDAYAKYQQNHLLSASPAKLLLAAYDGAIRFCRIGAEKMKAGELGEQSVNLNKALAIVCELLTTLDDKFAPQLVSGLKSLYVYVIEKIAHANLQQDEEALAEALKILLQLRETWSEADRIVQREIIMEDAA